MESLLGKTDEYGYEDVIINPYLADVKAAIGKLCFFSVSPKEVIETANKYKDEAKILADIKDGNFIDVDGTRWDCIIINRDKPKPKYVPFKTPSQFISAYECHRGENLGKALGCQLASLGGVWIKSVKGGFYAMVTEVYGNGVVTRPDCGLVSWSEVYTMYVFPDGTPCGNVSTGYSSKTLSSDELWEKAGRGGSISRDELGLSKSSSSSGVTLEQ